MKLGLDSCFGVGVVDGLVDSEIPKEVVLEDAKVEEKTVAVPGDSANNGASYSIEDEVVGRRDDGGQNEGRI